MKITKILLLCIFFQTSALQAAPFHMDCDVSRLAKLEEKLPHLTVTETRYFLSMFSKACLNNAEFSEYSNELLFKIMSAEPATFLKAIGPGGRKINLTIILNEIENPVNDDINLKDIRRKIAKLKGQNQGQVLRSLNKAIAKYK